MSAVETRCPIRLLKFAGIPVRDQDRALAFWTEKMGLRVATDQRMGPGQRWIELLIPGAETRLVLYTPDGHQDRVGTFFNGSFETADVDQAYEEMKARGVEFRSPPRKEPWGTSAMFLDSEGNQFVLSSRG